LTNGPKSELLRCSSLHSELSDSYQSDFA